MHIRQTKQSHPLTRCFQQSMVYDDDYEGQDGGARILVQLSVKFTVIFHAAISQNFGPFLS